MRVSPDDKRLIVEIAKTNNLSESELLMALLHDFVNQGKNKIVKYKREYEIEIKLPEKKDGT